MEASYVDMKWMELGPDRTTRWILMLGVFIVITTTATAVYKEMANALQYQSNIQVTC